MFKKDDRVIYTSPFSQLSFPAVVTAARDGGFYDLLVDVTGSPIEKPERHWPLKAVREDRLRSR